MPSLRGRLFWLLPLLLVGPPRLGVAPAKKSGFAAGLASNVPGSLPLLPPFSPHFSRSNSRYKNQSGTGFLKIRVEMIDTSVSVLHWSDRLAGSAG
jgi:hypothetical protein